MAYSTLLLPSYQMHLFLNFLNRVLLGHRPTVIELSALPGDLLGQGGHLGEESGAAYRVGGRRRVAGQLVILGGYVDHHSFGALPGPPPPKLVRPREVAGGGPR